MTDNAFADNCRNGKFHEEAPMKETFRSILDLLGKERYRHEQRVRFSLVARTCDKLNCNIWNPWVCDTEDQTDKFNQYEYGERSKCKMI